jgi:hypothetical protein
MRRQPTQALLLAAVCMQASITTEWIYRRLEKTELKHLISKKTS